MLVQFFNDNNRYEVMDRRNVCTYHAETAHNFNKSYDGAYAYALRNAVKEMTAYAEEIAWEKNKTHRPNNNVPVDVDAAKHSVAVAKPAVESTLVAPRGQKTVVPKEGPAMVVDETPTPVLADVDDVRPAASMDAEDVEFVFKNNVDVVSDDGYVITRETRVTTLDAPQMPNPAVDDDHDVIYLDRYPVPEDSGNAPQPKRDAPSATHVRVAREAVATPGRNVMPPNGLDSMQGVVVGDATPDAAFLPSQPATAPPVAMMVTANGSAVPVTPRKEPHSDDTSTESLPINVSPANENDSPEKLNGQGEAVEAQSGKRKMAQFEGVETSTPVPVVGAKISLDAPRKRKKKSVEQQVGKGKLIDIATGPKRKMAVVVKSRVGVGKGKLIDTATGPKRKSAVVAKSSMIDGGGEAGKPVNRGSRAPRSKKSSKATSAGGSGGEKAGSWTKEALAENVRSALRWRDEKIAVMQAQIDRLEGDDASKTGQEMVRTGLELIEPAKDMLKSAQDMLKSAHEMVKEGQKMMKRSG